jgi:hypothetical protein
VCSISQAGLIPRGSAHAHSVRHGFVAFLWQIPPIGPVLPVLSTYNCFAVNDLRLDRHLHTVEVVGSNPAVPTISKLLQILDLETIKRS